MKERKSRRAVSCRGSWYMNTRPDFASESEQVLAGRRISPVILRSMLHLLAQLGTTVLGEIVKKMITGGMAWAANRNEPGSDMVELKLSQIAEKTLPETIPADQRQAVVTSLVDLVMPTFEQIVEYNPNIQRMKSAIKKAPAKKPAKKSTYRVHPTKKSAVRASATKKSATVKKTGTKKASARKSAPRR
jgi:hypothetical protein